MKKLALTFTVVGLLSLGLSSCGTKECSCTTSVTGFDDVVTTVELEKGKCSDLDSEQSIAGIETSVVCK